MFPKEPFEKGDVVKVFLRRVKNNDLEAIHKMLWFDPLLVYQTDDMY